MMRKLLQMAWAVRAQLILLTVLLALKVLTSVGWIPSIDEMIVFLHKLLKTGGFPLIAIAIFAESIIGLNVYFPGSVVILVSMALTAGNPLRAIITFVVIVIFSLIAHLCNYALGRTLKRSINLPEHRAQRVADQLKRKNIWVVFLISFWHPHLAAVACYGSGFEGVPFSTFVRLLLVSSLIWNSFWGFVMYNFGEVANATQSLVPLVYVYILVWLLWDLWKFMRNEFSITKMEQ